jgi:BMFP domain-containing protein YqiC
VFDKNWRALYAAAVLEVDPVKLELRVRALEAAIRARQSLDGEVSSEERAAMQDALNFLGVLKREREQGKK